MCEGSGLRDTQPYVRAETVKLWRVEYSVRRQKKKSLLRVTASEMEGGRAKGGMDDGCRPAPERQGHQRGGGDVTARRPPARGSRGRGGGAEPKASGETVASEGLQCAARGALALDGVLGGHGDGRQELGDLAQVGGVSKEGVGKELRGGGPLFGLLPEA